MFLLATGVREGKKERIREKGGEGEDERTRKEKGGRASEGERGRG